MNIRYQYRYAAGLLKRYGLRGLMYKILERKQSPMLAYTKCYRRFLPTDGELSKQRDETFPYEPLVSIVVPAYETSKQYLCALVESVQAQSYTNWELCLADGSRTEQVERTAAFYAKTDARIRYQRLSENGGISENTNSGFQMARGEYIALMDHDDVLAHNALYEMVKFINEKVADSKRNRVLLYSDEDKINADGSVHSRPHFKPDYNPEFLRHNNYFCHFLLFARELLERAGGLDKEFDGAQDYDFVLRCVDAGAYVGHVPKILYHWRIHEGSTAGNSTDKAYAFDNGCRAIANHLKRRREPGDVRVTPNLGVYRVTYRLLGDYALTVVAEEQEQLARLREYYKQQSYEGRGYRLTIHYLLADSFQNGVETQCIGDYILYIRKGVRVRPEGLAETLLGSCQHPKTGVVAAKLLYQNKRVASCGMIYDTEGGLAHASRGIPAAYKGYFLHAVIPQNYSAASLGCAMFRRDAFLQADGFDEAFVGDYRDADFCFRLQERGYQVVVTPEASAIWRPADPKTDAAGFLQERQRKLFWDRWGYKLSKPDPCYNCNMTMQGRLKE